MSESRILSQRQIAKFLKSHKKSSSMQQKSVRPIKYFLEEQSRRKMLINHKPCSSSKKFSLPSIFLKQQTKHLSIDEKRTEALSKFIKQKSLNQKHKKSRKVKTESKEPKTQKSVKMMSKRQIFLNASENRMKPVDRYFTALENVRLAGKLLSVKPSKQLNQEHMKRFYQEQQYYSSKIRKNFFLKKHLKLCRNKNQLNF